MGFGLLFILYYLWHHSDIKAAEKKLDNSHFEPMKKALDQLDNAFIRVETKRRKQMSEEYFEQRLKTIEEKKED